MPQICGMWQRGSSVFLHDNEKDRSSAVVGDTTTIYTGGHPS